MKFRKLISCLLVVMLLCAFAFSTFAEARERSAFFSATTINKGYTFKNFARPNYAETVGVRATELTYKDGGYYYFQTYTCDNNGTRTCTVQYEKIYEGESDKDLTLTSAGQLLSYFNLRVDNAAYKAGTSSSNTLSVEGVAQGK